MIIIDSRMRKIEKEKLKLLGHELYEIECNPELYFEISAHVDVHCLKINNHLITAPYLKIPNSTIGISNPQNQYPLDIPYNACIFNNYAIHNFKYTDSKIVELLDKYNYKKINIKQGYSKCSIAVIDENSVIVTDKTIAETLSKYNIEVLLLNPEITQNIHLLKNNKNEYSDMTGFIGGIISRIDDYIFISGDLKQIDPHNTIKKFIEKRNIKIIDFPELDLIDYGGLLKI